MKIVKNQVVLRWYLKILIGKRFFYIAKCLYSNIYGTWMYNLLVVSNILNFLFPRILVCWGAVGSLPFECTGYWVNTNLQTAGSSQVGEELDDVGGHRRGSRQVVSSSLESVLIGDPVGGDGESFRGDVGVRSAGHSSNVFGLRSDSLLEAVSFYLNSVFACKTTR